MFFRYIIKDSIVLTPEELKDEQGNLCKKLEEKFLLRIIEKEGLCVYILEYKLKDATVLHTEGDIIIQLEISLILFKMFENELFIGHIVENTKEGIIISLQELVHIFIPGALLNNPSYYDEKEGLWVWKCSKTSQFYYEINREIRLKGWKSNFDGVPTTMSGVSIDSKDLMEVKNEKGYFFLGKLNEDGLGPIAGWSSFK